MAKKILIDGKVKKHLEKDLVMKTLIKKYSAPEFIRNDNLFLDVIQTIINQQLSSKAAYTIFQRFKALFKRKDISAENVLKISDDAMRNAGISFAKIKYIKGFAKIVLEKEINLQQLQKATDEKIIEELVKVKGIGRWSAEMMLMFSFNRPDVFSTGDLGLCSAIAKLYHLDRKDKKSIEALSLSWSPYRTSASWYLWRSLENSAAK